MPADDVLVALRGISQEYHGLRPLRIQQLDLRPQQSIALLGFDLPMAEVLVNLITGTSLPGVGEVRVFGQSTRDITTADDWVANLDRFGLISERAVLVDQLTVEQSLAMPISLELEDMPAQLRAQVRALADEVSLPGEILSAPTASLSPLFRIRLRLGRALALGPRVLLAEHPNSTLGPDDAPVFAADLARVISARGLASLVLTADRTFASAVADQVLTLEPATGALKAATGWRRWFA